MRSAPRARRAGVSGIAPSDPRIAPIIARRPRASRSADQRSPGSTTEQAPRQPGLTRATLDEAGTRHSAAGTPLLLVTNVINHALPLIRYELADELTVLAEPNPGPWTGRRIADIEGRVEGTFVYAGGVEIHLHLFRSALGRRRQVLEYQVRQTPMGADIAIPTSARHDTDALSRELVQALTELGVARPQVSIAEVQEIERTETTGKLRRFIPLAPRRD